MGLPDAGAISLSAVATQLGLSSTNISLSNAGNTAAGGYTANVHMDFFHTPAPPSVSSDGSQVTISVAESWPTGATFSFYRTAANGVVGGPYSIKITHQSGYTWVDSSVIPTRGYWYKVLVYRPAYGYDSILSDGAHIVV